jgi:hypothetical protein
MEPDLRKRRSGSHLSEAEVKQIRKAIESGESSRTVARRFGVSHTYAIMLTKRQYRSNVK